MRPYISESLQNIRPPINIPIEYIHCEYGFHDSSTPKYVIISGNTGISIHIPSISKKAVASIINIIEWCYLIFRRLRNILLNFLRSPSCSATYIS